MRRGRRRALGAAALAAGAAAVAALGASDPAPGDGERKRGGIATPRVPPAPAPGIEIGPPVPLGDGRHETRWAPVRRGVTALASPRPGAQRVARVPTATPEGTRNLVVALARRTDGRGRVWVRVRLAVLPNGRKGWVPRAALGGYTIVRTRLIVDRRRLTATLLRGGRRVFRARVGIGTPAAHTPAGEFYVRARLEDFDDPFYGPLAFGTNARSPTLTDWPEGGFVGIHGTNEPGRLPGRVSHGCIRLRNADILRLARLMPVGTPLTIR